MNKLNFNEDREENPFFYELVRFNREENLDRAQRSRYVREGRENGKPITTLIIKGEGLEDLMENHVGYPLMSEIMDRDSVGDYIKRAEKFDGAILIDGERIYEPALLRNISHHYFEQHPSTASLDQELSRFIPHDFIHQNGRYIGFFGNEVSVGKLVGGRTEAAILLPRIYDGVKAYGIKSTARGDLGTGPVVMFGPNGLERMCYFKQENYAGGVLAVVRSYEFDPAQGKVVETGEFEFKPAELLEPYELRVPQHESMYSSEYA